LPSGYKVPLLEHRTRYHRVLQDGRHPLGSSSATLAPLSVRGAICSQAQQIADVLRPDMLTGSDIQNCEDFKIRKQIMGKLLFGTYLIMFYLGY